MRNLTREQVFGIIDDVISELKECYCSASDRRYRFLSEDDFKCYLYARLHEKLYGQNDPFDCNVALHSEVSFGLDGRYDNRPDISLFFRNYFRDSRCFNFKCPGESVVAFIEIKFVKSRSQDTLALIDKDAKKLQRLLWGN